MRQLKLALLLVAALAVGITSCTEDENTDKSPVLNFKGGEGYISQDATVKVGDIVKIGVTASSNKDTEEKLVALKATVTAMNQVVMEADTTFKAKYFDTDFTMPVTMAGEAVVKFTVTDKKGENASKSIKITAEEATTALSDPMDFTWKRVGTNATGLDMFGLKWKQNVTRATVAQIVKDGATKLVKFPAPQAWMVKDQETLKGAIDQLPDMDKYEGISTTKASDYDEVLGVVYNDTYYILHITKATVESATAGTTISIMGQYKK